MWFKCSAFLPSRYSSLRFLSGTPSLPVCLRYLPMYPKERKDMPQNIFECDREIIWFMAGWSCCFIAFHCLHLLNKESQTLGVMVKQLGRLLVFWSATKKHSMRQIYGVFWFPETELKPNRYAKPGFRK